MRIHQNKRFNVYFSNIKIISQKQSGNQFKHELSNQIGFKMKLNNRRQPESTRNRFEKSNIIKIDEINTSVQLESV